MKSLLLTAALLVPTLGFAGSSTESVDIGEVAVAGSTGDSDGIYTVRASGADIWGTEDEFRFVYAAMSGDGEITAQVASVTTADSWTKAGVMIRETLSPNSRYAYALVAATQGVAFQYRLSPGAFAGMSGANNPQSRAPYWVRLRRTDNIFRAYVSADGQNWRRHGRSISIAMGATVYAGLAVTSHRDGTLATGTFSNLEISANDTPPPPPQPPPTTNAPPTITGTPPGSVTAGAVYAFTPTASDPDGNPLTFNITNRPSWATFNTSTGRLAGTPTSADVGTFASIVIRVSDEQATASLPAFAIVVNATPNGAPVISGTPSTSVMQGTPYAFEPSASDADGDPLTFSVSNAPSWATFSAATGGLQGTPTAADVGTFSNIVITVNDGKTTTSLPAFSINVLAVTNGSATLTWTPPTTNNDGSALTNLAGYRVYWGPAAGNYTQSVSLNNPGLATYVVGSLVPGTYYFAVAAVNSLGAESPKSNVGSKTVQ